MREFVLYTDNGTWIERFHLNLQKEAASHRVDVMARTDPDCSTYHSFVSR
jgi:hypothetical protein